MPNVQNVTVETPVNAESEIIIPCVTCGKDCSSSYRETPEGAMHDKCFRKKYRVCTDCGKVIDKNDAKTIGRKSYCTDCYSTHIVICDYCGKEVAKDAVTVAGDKKVCDTCFGDHYVTCDDCGVPVLKTEAQQYYDDELCQYCYSNKTIVCSACGTQVPMSSVTYVEGKPYCFTCCEEHTVECDFCHTRININNAYADEYIYLCSDCYLHHYVTCDACRNFVIRNDAVSRGNNIYCPECYPSRTIHDYSYKPVPRFYGGKDENDIFMGVELEVDNGGENETNGQKVLSIANKEYPYVYIKHDGSLSNGFELVSYPATIQWHMTRTPWEAILKKLKSMNYRSHDSRTCGLHVHISRKAFGTDAEEQDMNIMKLLYFVEKFWSKMVRFSRRNEDQLQRWARRYGMKNTPKELLDTAKHSERYYAVNLRNEKTVEIRMYRGTLNYNSFIATLQFTHELVRILRELTVDEVATISWDAFVGRISPQFLDLTKYLNRRGLATDVSFGAVSVNDSEDDLVEVV